MMDFASNVKIWFGYDLSCSPDKLSYGLLTRSWTFVWNTFPTLNSDTITIISITNTITN